jgi:hypothetical protein
MDLLVLFSVLIAIAYILLYLGGRYYLRQGFQDGGRNCQTVLDTTITSSKPYVTNENQYGDFEQDVIYQNEGGFNPTQEAINMAKRKFPFDWSQLPPSSSLFQAQQALFSKDPLSTTAPFVPETFQNIESLKVLPPELTEEDELKMYQAKTTEDLSVVDKQSVDQMIQNIYGKKGFVAKVAEKANNVFEVYELQEKDPKIVYEDEVQASIQDNELNRPLNAAELLVSPDPARQIQNDLMPFGRGESVGVTRQEYSQYNPNLEAIFGPRMQWQQWG